jgi:putative addiction module component (TIGR02574 family)
MAKPAVDIDSLSRDERLALLEQVWESLSREAESLPLTAEQTAELDRRLDDLDREGPVGATPEELRAQVRRRS